MIATVIGASGGIGNALLAALTAQGFFDEVIGFSRSSEPALDLLDEASIARCAKHIARTSGEPRLFIVATGVLMDGDRVPEKSWRQLDPETLARQFAINAIGPALVMKHFLPLLPRKGRVVFACLSARVGSIGDNRLGGWYGYRASKAALNQFVRTAAVELARTRPDAICVALHPGTVSTALSRPFAAQGPEVASAPIAAGRLIGVINGLTALDTGGFFDHTGARVVW